MKKCRKLFGGCRRHNRERERLRARLRLFLSSIKIYRLCIVASLLLFMFFNTAYALDADSVWAKLWGTAEPEPMLGLGMWSYHLKHESQDMDNSQNDLLGFSYRGLFAATFIN